VLEVTVLVDEAHLATIHDLAEALRRAGLRGGQALSGVGVITGAVDEPGVLSVLGQVDGVSKVEAGRAYQLPPPDAPVQ